MASSCKLLVQGMHCPSCVRHIEDLLSEQHVRNAAVSLFAGTVTFDHDADFDLKQVLRSLKDSGYQSLLPEKQTAIDAGELPHRAAGGSSWLASLLPSKRKQRRRHKAVCEACQQDDDSIEHKPPIEAAPVQWSKSIFSVEGMTCGSCVGSLKTGLQGDGIKDVVVTLIPGRAEVTHDALKITADALVALIEDLGYDARLERTEALEPDARWHVRLAVRGMTCASCTGAVKSVIAANMGVEAVVVDLLNGLATFTSSREEDAANIKAEVEDAGFECDVVDNRRGAGDGDENAALRNIRLHVDGMFCSECIVKVNAALEAISSEHADVAFSPISLDSPFTNISYRPQPSTLAARVIRNRVEALGFACTAAPADSLEKRAAAARARDRRLILLRLLVTLVFAVPTFIIAIVGMSLLSSDHAFRRYWESPIWGMATRGEIALWILATPVQFGVGAFFYRRSWKSLRTVWRRRTGKTSFRAIWLPRLFRWGSMDTLVALGTSLAYLSSIVFLALDVSAPMDGAHAGDMGYFDTSVFLILFILAGRYLEAWSKQYSGDAVTELSKTKASTGLLINAADARSASPTEEVDAAFIEIGDLLLIPAGSSPPVDGVLTDSSSPTSFDESALTGEARPVAKKAGDAVYAGTINAGPSAATIRVTTVSGQSMVDGIATAVRDAMSRKAGIERLADQITAYFVPAVVGIACFTLVVWLLRGYLGDLPSDWLADRREGSWALFAVEFAVAVLVVACPCGIGLAAPTAQLVGVGLAAKNGILPNGGGEAFQAYSRLDAIVFDKTGTLTTSNFSVSDAELLVEGDDQRSLIWAIANAVEATSSHPLSMGLRKRCEVEAIQAPRVEVVSGEEIAGHGLAAIVQVGDERYEVVIGNEELMQDRGANYASTSLRDQHAANVLHWQKAAKSVILLAIRPASSTSSAVPNLDASQYRILALFSLHDPPRAEAFRVVDELTRRKIDVYMCTGDNETTARAVALSVGIDPDHIVAHAVPLGKRRLVQKLQTSCDGHRSIVAFCGDGINDSPALAQADAGIAMGSGSAVALQASHFTLIGGTHPLLGLVTLSTLSRATVRKIYANFAWASLYNALLVPLAAGAFYSLGQTRLPPVWASLAMALSSISVVLSSLALKVTYRVPKLVREFDGRA